MQNASRTLAQEAAAAPVSNDMYVGTYSTTSMPIKIDIKVENGGLVAQATGQSAFPLTPNGKDKFSFEAAGIDLEFNTAKGEFTITQGGNPIVFTREGGPVVVAATVAPAAPAKGKKK